MLLRNQTIYARWYQIFLDRIHLLVPSPEHIDSRQPEVGDVCLFVHQDPNYYKLWTWRLGLIHEKLSRSTYSIKYFMCRAGNIRYLTRSVKQISIIVPVDQLHTGHKDFLKTAHF